MTPKQHALKVLSDICSRSDEMACELEPLHEAISAITEAPPVPTKLADVLTRLDDVLNEHSWVDDDECDELLGAVAALPVMEAQAEVGYRAEVARAFFREVDRRAQNNMLKTGKLEGSHYAAMQQVLEEWEGAKQA